MRFKKGIAFLLGFVIIGAIGYAGFKYFTEKPPVSEINGAREALANAKTLHAGKYAGTRLKEAEILYNEAMQEWSLQNKKLFFLRDYSQSKNLAIRSASESLKAANEAGIKKSTYKKQLKGELEKLAIQIANFEKYYKKLPLSREVFNGYNKGKISYLEACTEFERNDLQQAIILSKQAKDKLGVAEKLASSILKDFYRNYSEWKKDAQTARQLSKKGKIVILVNKMESTCTVLKSEKTIRTFEAEFGPNWMGDKKMKGDKATPEGVYKIAKKKKGTNTKYYKAFLLDYPNDKDKKRFAELKKAGLISKNTHIGGLIEIHGGGKGVNWTDGCVALTNSDMDIIYDICPVGTPVIIIGSEKSLTEYLNGGNGTTK